MTQPRYHAVDVLASPYTAEGFNMPVLEAMACGVTVVVTEGGYVVAWVVVGSNDTLFVCPSVDLTPCLSPSADVVGRQMNSRERILRFASEAKSWWSLPRERRGGRVQRKSKLRGPCFPIPCRSETQQ